MRLLLLSLFMVFAGLSVQADVTHEQVEQIRKALVQTTEDRIFFHWTKEDVGARWSTQGYIDGGEVDFYNKPTGDRQVYGSGIYMAESPTSSKQFGDFPVVFVIPKGAYIYDDQAVAKVLKHQATDAERITLSQHLPFIRNVTDDWWLTNSSRLLGRVEYGGKHGAHANFLGASPSARSMQEYITKYQTRPGAEYLESLFHLMFYMDGVSLVRAIRVAPQNPWSQFEPEHFESFKKINKEILSTPKSSGGRFWHNGNPDKAAWVQQQVETDLPQLMKDLFNTSQIDYRGHGIRAGGSSEGNTFAVSPQELLALLENPYLTVEYKPSSDKKSFLVSYQYPDIEKFEKLLPLLSEDFVADVKKQGLNKILASQDARVQWNQKLIRNLLSQLFSSLYNSYIEPAEFLSKFIAIHPYSDGNGRTARLYLQKAMSAYGSTLPPMFISDVDLLLKPNDLARVLNDSSEAYNKLFQSMSAEFRLKQTPEYFNLKEFPGLIESLAIFGLKGSDFPGRQYDDAIRHRQFHEMFAEIKGDGWNTIMDESLPKALKLARENGLESYVATVSANIDNLFKSLKPGKEFYEVLTELRKYQRLLASDPYFAKKFENIEFRLMETALRWDPKDKYFDGLNSYLRNLSPALLRKFSQRMMNRTDLSQDQKESFQRSYVRAEINALFRTLGAGRLPLATFESRLSNLATLNAGLISSYNYDTNSMILALSKLNIDGKIRLLGMLEVHDWPWMPEAQAELTKIGQYLASLPADQKPELRTQISDLLARSSGIPVETQEANMNLALKVDPNLKYRLSETYHGLSPDMQAWAIRTIQGILVEEFSKPAPHKITGQYVMHLVWAKKSVPGTKEQLIKALNNLAKSDRDWTFSELGLEHFKKPLYEAAVSIMKNEAVTEAQKEYLAHDLVSYWNKLIPLMNKSPYQERWLRLLWADTGNYVTVKQRTEYVAYFFQFPQITGTAFADELRQFVLKRAEAYFLTSSDIAAFPKEISMVMSRDTRTWDLMSDGLFEKMRPIIIQNIDVILSYDIFIQNPKRLQAITDMALKAGRKDVYGTMARKIFQYHANPFSGDIAQFLRHVLSAEADIYKKHTLPDVIVRNISKMDEQKNMSGLKEYVDGLYNFLLPEERKVILTAITKEVSTSYSAYAVSKESLDILANAGKNISKAGMCRHVFTK